MKAVIPVAGLGTRFLPTTKAVPKELLPVVDKPVLQYVVEEAIEAECDDVVLVNSPGKKSIPDYFSPAPDLEAHLLSKGKEELARRVRHAGGLPVRFAEQPEARGLGHAVACAAEAVGGEPFIVMLGDVIVPDNGVCRKMAQVSRDHGGAAVIAVMPVPDDEVSRFGIVGGEDLGGGVWRVSEMVEKPPADEAPSNLAIFGRYLLPARVMELLAETAPGAGGEIQLTDALIALLAEQDVYALVVDPAEGFDTGTVESWLAANVALAMRDPHLAGYLRAEVGKLFAE